MTCAPPVEVAGVTLGGGFGSRHGISGLTIDSLA